jgi:hypothetical protein
MSASQAAAVPTEYRPENNVSVVNNINNNIKNAVNAAAGGGDMSNALLKAFKNPLGRYWMTRVMHEAIGSLPKEMKGLLSPDFEKMVSDSEKAAQDKELYQKMQNYIGDVKTVLSGLKT